MTSARKIYFAVAGGLVAAGIVLAGIFNQVDKHLFNLAFVGQHAEGSRRKVEVKVVCCGLHEAEDVFEQRGGVEWLK